MAKPKCLAWKRVRNLRAKAVQSPVQLDWLAKEAYRDHARAVRVHSKTMIRNALSDRPTRIPHGLGFHRQYLYVDDAADALIAAFDRPNLPRRTYSVTGGTYLTMQEIADIVKRVLPNADIKLRSAPDSEDGVQPRFDTSAAARDIGFRPNFTFEEGVRKYVAWLRAPPF